MNFKSVLIKRQKRQKHRHFLGVQERTAVLSEEQRESSPSLLLEIRTACCKYRNFELMCFSHHILFQEYR